MCPVFGIRFGLLSVVGLLAGSFVFLDGNVVAAGGPLAAGALHAPLSPGWVGQSDLEAAAFGYSVSGAGDVNGDGYDDVIVGAYGYANGQDYEGRAFAYYGSPTGLSTTPNWTAESDQAFAIF